MSHRLWRSLSRGAEDELEKSRKISHQDRTSESFMGGWWEETAILKYTETWEIQKLCSCLSEKWPSYDQVFEHLVPSGWYYGVVIGMCSSVGRSVLLESGCRSLKTHATSSLLSLLHACSLKMRLSVACYSLPSPTVIVMDSHPSRTVRPNKVFIGCLGCGILSQK